MVHRPSPSPLSDLAILGVGLACTPTLAVAQWPTDPATPLVFGQAETETQLRHGIAADGTTWVAWIDGLCFGQVRLQGIDAAGIPLTPSGMLLEETAFCGTTEIMLAVATDGSAIVQGGGPASDRPVHRIAVDGTALWGAGVQVAWLGGLDVAVGLPDGDVLLGGHAGMSNFIGRYDVTGNEVWTVEIPTPHTSNRRVRGLVPDDSGGTFLVYDIPLAYTRLVAAVHVASDGVSSWTDPLIVVPPDPSSSRHTDPVVLADGSGGVVIVFARGNESADTPVPLLMQRFDVSGQLAFDVQGARVSLDAERQYDPIVTRDEATGELIIAWRSGSFAGQQLRAQRMTVAGDRLWGDTGVTIAEMGPQGTSWFDAVWDGRTLAGVVSRPQLGTASVHVHSVDGNGVVAPVPVALSGETDSQTIAAGAVGRALTVSWFDHVGGFDGDLVAQRLNPDGSLGLIEGDVDGDGLVDVTDLLALLTVWGPCPAPCLADFDGDGITGVTDLLTLLANWS